MTNSTNWKTERIQAVKETIEFFRNENKLEREKWVVAQLLENIIPDFSFDSLDEAEEPADVRFEKVNFQVKEVLEYDRRRGDENKAALEKAETAEEYSELLEDYSPCNISFEEIAIKCYEYSKKLVKKYGPLERRNMDLIFYFNHLDSNEIPSDAVTFCDTDFRSFSIVSNRYRSVIYACESAPEDLKKHVGVRIDILGK